MKIIKWFLIISVSIVIILFGLFKYMKMKTKKHSPEQTVIQKIKGSDISVFYCRPYKKGRRVFGQLVPYGEVWRTGANEATTFSTSKDITVVGKKLPAGKYTIWTIPQASSWKVVFNEGSYRWGIGLDGKAAYDSVKDVLEIEVPVQEVSEVVEQFTIKFEETSPIAMTMAWDNIKVSLPMN